MFSLFPVFNSRIAGQSLLLSFVFMLGFLTLVPIPPAWGFDLRRIEAAEAAGKTGEWIFMDARPLKKYQENHIPGAVSFSWETYTRTDADGVKYRIFPPGELAGILGKMGVRNADAVVVYGDADASWGGEGWVAWMLAWLGHQGPVYYLDGGIQGWLAAGHPVNAGAANKRSPSAYTFQVQPGVTITAREIMSRQKDIVLIDTRSYLTEWLPGHLPGAVHIPWEKFYHGTDRRALSSKELKALLKQHGVDTRKPVVYYCTGGIRSGFAWMAHQLSGLPGAINFEGGTEEWNRTNQSPTKL